MKIKDEEGKFESCLQLATEAKRLRDEAKELEEKAVESFRQVRNEMLSKLQHDKEMYEEELNALNEIKSEYFNLASTFCEQKGEHTYGLSAMKKYIRICLICGYEKIPEIPKSLKNYGLKDRQMEPLIMLNRCGRPIIIMPKKPEPYSSGSEKIIQEAKKQNENLELKKTAQRIIKIRNQFKNINHKLDENRKGFEEICSLFGHDAVLTDSYNETFKCKCCGKEMGYQEYIKAHYNAKYRGGIVSFYYDDFNPILL